MAKPKMVSETKKTSKYSKCRDDKVFDAVFIAGSAMTLLAVLLMMLFDTRLVPCPEAHEAEHAHEEKEE